jgi:hypothetical protein
VTIRLFFKLRKKNIKLRYCRTLFSLTTRLFFKLYVTYGLLLNDEYTLAGELEKPFIVGSVKCNN